MTYNDFVMESAMVEATNDTDINDISMAQLDAEMSVLEAFLDCAYKYNLISEYAECDVDEFYEESAADWLKEKASSVGSTLKKWGETILEKIKTFVKWVINIFKGGSTFEGLAKKAEKIKDKALKAEDITPADMKFKVSRQLQMELNMLDKIIAAYNKLVSAIRKDKKSNSLTTHGNKIDANYAGINTMIGELNKDLVTIESSINKIHTDGKTANAKYGNLNQSQLKAVGGQQGKTELTIDELISELKTLAKKSEPLDSNARKLLKECEIAKSTLSEYREGQLDKSAKADKEKVKEAKNQGLEEYKQIKKWADEIFEAYAKTQKVLIRDYKGMIDEMNHWEKKLAKSVKKGDVVGASKAGSKMQDGTF